MCGFLCCLGVFHISIWVILYVVCCMLFEFTIFVMCLLCFNTRYRWLLLVFINTISRVLLLLLFNIRILFLFLI